MTVDEQRTQISLDHITNRIIGAAIRLHQKLGPGLLESVYELLLAHMLVLDGIRVMRQYPVPIKFDGIQFEEGFRIDLLVEECVIVEIKSLQRLTSIHQKQILTHLRLMDLRVGLLINFGAATLKEGLTRVVNDLVPGNSPILRVNRSDR